MELADLIEAIKSQAKALADKMASPPTLTAQEAFRKYADPDAILNSPEAQAGASFSPIGMAGIFTGPMSRLTTVKQILQAAEGERAGLHPDRIWQESMMVRSPVDMKLRTEIPDAGAQLLTVPGKGEQLPLDMILGHPGGLFEAYPQLRDLPVIRGPQDMSYFLPRAAKAGESHIALSPNSPQPLSSLLHEIQHAVQEQEGFAMGASMSNPKVLAIQRATGAEPIDIYRGMPGEVEARNTQARMLLDQPARKLLPPWVTQDKTQLFGGKTVGQWLADIVQGSK